MARIDHWMACGAVNPWDSYSLVCFSLLLFLIYLTHLSYSTFTHISWRYTLIGPYFRIPLFTTTLVYETVAMSVLVCSKSPHHRPSVEFSPLLLFLTEHCFHARLLSQTSKSRKLRALIWPQQETQLLFHIWGNHKKQNNLGKVNRNR